MAMKDHDDVLAQRQARVKRMGGDEAVARQHAAGKLTVRERIDRLLLRRRPLERAVPPDAGRQGWGNFNYRRRGILHYR